MAWFPRDAWPRATELWPDLLDDRPADPDAYSHATEAPVKAIRDSFAIRVPLAIAPIRLDAYLAYCEAHGYDPVTGGPSLLRLAARAQRGCAALAAWAQRPVLVWLGAEVQALLRSRATC